MIGGNAGAKKRHRVGTTSRISSTAALIDSSHPDGTLTEVSIKPLPSSSSSIRRSNSRHSLLPHGLSSTANGFNDSSTADVILRLYLDQSSPFDSDDSETQLAVDSSSEYQIYLHSNVLRRSKYFSALLSDRWKKNSSDVDFDYYRFNLAVPSSAGSINNHVTVLQLLYSNEISSAIDTASTALELLPVALELLFEDCVTACVRYLEAVPWTEEEERTVLSLIPLLRDEESSELLARVSVSPQKSDLSEEMLHGLILTAIHNHPNMAFAKAFVAKLLRDFSSRDSARRVLDKSFETSLNVVKESLEEYSSPDFRGDHNETEAIQRLNLHTAMTNGRHLLWLIERMIELRAADTAVKVWSEQASFTSDLQRAFRDDAWRNIVPGLPSVVLRCTCKLANAVAAGVILASRQVCLSSKPKYNHQNEYFS